VSATVGLLHAVVDASVVVDFLFRRRDATVMLRLLANPEAELHVPQLCDVEVAAGIRRGLHHGRISTVATARSLLQELVDLPLERYDHGPLIDRVLDLHANFTAYDAAYVALAEALGIPLLTADSRLARATRAHTDVEVVDLAV